MIEKRPRLNENMSLKDFKDFYWLKEELVLFCKKNEIDCSGGKIEITDRIIYFLETGKKDKKHIVRKSKSNFDWNVENLSRETIITDNYKNTENVRRFFLAEIGTHFKFNVLFMNWMKQNTSKTLQNAVDEWNRIQLLKKDKNYRSEIGSQFEYNAYMRDFLNDNPHLTINDARKYWMFKRQTRGNKTYTKSDLQLKQKI